jgi:putative transposase
VPGPVEGANPPSAESPFALLGLPGECLGKLVLLGENHLRTAVREYVAHYHNERNHQGLDGRLIEQTANTVGAGPIICRERVGELLRFYHHQAA